MSFTELLEPILKGGIRSVNFFNGRLLSAEDLKQEQEANREGRARLGQALGPGVAFGLDVALAAANTAETPVVTVGAGLAVSREGRALKLTSPVDLALIPQSDDTTPTGATFKDCKQTRGGVYVSGVGVYLLTIAPAEGAEGRAPFSGLGNTVVTCNTRYRVEGVQFRLVRLLNSTQLGTNLKTLRSRVAYDCLGADALQKFERQPLGTPPAGYGLLDAARPSQLGDAEVPLALVYWASGGIGFVDEWSVRRPLTAGSGSERFETLAGGRRQGEAVAALLHFQDHVAAVRSDTSVADTNTLKAEDHFAFLPPAGLLPLGTNAQRGFDWGKFLGPHAPPRVTNVDEGLLRSLLERALLLDPVKLGPFAVGADYSGGSPPAPQPPVPYSVYRVPEADFVLFARSPRGRVRVFLYPPNALVTAGQVYAESATHGNLRFNANVVARSGVYPVVNLDAGEYNLTVDAPGLLADSVSNVPVVEGRTTDVLFTINTPGSLLLTINDANTHNSIGGAVQSVTLTREQGGGATLTGAKTAGDKWLVVNVPPGKYTLRVTADKYVAGELSGVEITVGESKELTIELTPVPVTTGLIKLEISDKVSQARIDASVTEVKATNVATGNVVSATKANNLWSFVEIPAGTYNIEAKAPNYSGGVVSNFAIKATEIKTVSVQLQPAPGKIVLTVTDLNTGQAIDGIVGGVTATAGSLSFTGARVGNKWEINNVTPGTYSVRVTAPNYRDLTITNVQVGVAGTVNKDAKLEPLKGIVSLTLTWPSGYKVGTFEAIVMPQGYAALPAVSFDQSNNAVVREVPAGNITVRIREKNNAYPDTVFGGLLLPAGTYTRSVGLPSRSISYTIGANRPIYKPRSSYDWSVDPSVIESPPSGVYNQLDPSLPTRADVRNWLIAWRNWLVVAHDELGLDRTATPEVVSVSDLEAQHSQNLTGRAIFYKPGGARVGMKLNVSVDWDPGYLEADNRF